MVRVDSFLAKLSAKLTAREGSVTSDYRGRIDYLKGNLLYLSSAGDVHIFGTCASANTKCMTHWNYASCQVLPLAILSELLQLLNFCPSVSFPDLRSKLLHEVGGWVSLRFNVKGLE